MSNIERPRQPRYKPDTARYATEGYTNNYRPFDSTDKQAGEAARTKPKRHDQPGFDANLKLPTHTDPTETNLRHVAGKDIDPKTLADIEEQSAKK